MSSSPFSASSDPNLIARVPEPETYGLVLTGLALAGLMSRRRKTA